MQTVIDYDEMEQARSKITSIAEEMAGIPEGSAPTGTGYDSLEGAISQFTTDTSDSVSDLHTQVTSLSTNIDAGIKAFQARESSATTQITAVKPLLDSIVTESLK